MTESSPLLPLKGEFLLAMPTLTDPNFAGSVVCMCELSSSGALGLVINRTYADFTAKEIFEELHLEAGPTAALIPIYKGGPVNLGEVFVLHGPPFTWKGCLMVNPWLAMTNTRDIMEALAVGRGPDSFLIVLGCSGWGREQLEMELKGNFWLTCPANRRIVFEVPEENRWSESLKLMNIEPAMFSGQAGNA